MITVRVIWPVIAILALGVHGCGGGPGQEKPPSSTTKAGEGDARWSSLPLPPDGLNLSTTAALFDVTSSRPVVDLSADGVLRVEGESLGVVTESQGYCCGVLHTLTPAQATVRPGEPQVPSVDLKSCRLIPARVSVLDDQGAFPGLVALDIPKESVPEFKVGTSRVSLFVPEGATAEQIRSIPTRPVKLDDQSVARYLEELKRRDALAEKQKQRDQFVQVSTNNLKQIGLAIHNFVSANECFPPAVVNGPDGKPWHSWRVLILPYLEQPALYNAYHFDEPWDGPNNNKLLDRMPEVYRKPGDRSNYTHYVAPTGPEVAFPSQPARTPENKSGPNDSRVFDEKGPGLRRITNFADGTSNTICIGTVEPERKILWMSPVDLPIEFPRSPTEAKQTYPRRRTISPSLKDPNGFATPYDSDDGPFGLFLFADGSVHHIHRSTNEVVFSALMTFNGGEVISYDSFGTGSTKLTPALAQPVYKLQVVASGSEPVARFQEVAPVKEQPPRESLGGAAPPPDRAVRPVPK